MPLNLLLLLLFGSSITDYWITSRLVQIHGYEVELNPLLYGLITTADSSLPILVTKLISLLAYLAVAWLIVNYFRNYKRVFTYSTAGLACASVGVCLWGAFVLSSSS